MDFATAFNIAKFAEKIGTIFYSAQKSAKGHKRKILLELQENIDVTRLWKDNEFSADKVALKLGRKNYDAAVSDDFKFNTIKSSNLRKATTKNVPQFQKYVGWSTEKLVDNLYRKIKIIKNIVEMEADNNNVDKDARLGNIYKIMILLAHHINS